MANEAEKPKTIEQKRSDLLKEWQDQARQRAQEPWSNRGPDLVFYQYLNALGVRVGTIDREIQRELNKTIPK